MSENNGNNKKSLLPLICLNLGIIAALFVPVSNLFLQRQVIEDKSGDPKLAAFSKVMQASCVDCHTANMTTYPVYFQLPVAKDIIARDIKEARAAFLIDQDQLGGVAPISPVDLAKIATEVQEGAMPPMRYKALHWNSSLSPEQKQAVLDFVKSRSQATATGALPLENPFHPDPAKAALGEKLFFDKRLSGDNTVSCASCHSLEKGGCDQEVTATGIRGQKGPINAPTVFNSAYNFCQFWDGRARDLKEQAAGPVENPGEMGAKFEDVIAKLKDDTVYSAESNKLYKGPLSKEVITDAIAEYEKTLITPGSAFDHYLKGDRQALSAQAQEGYKLFTDKGCASCHAGPSMGGMSFEKMGVSKDYFAYREKARGLKLTEADNGRFNVSKESADMHKFKVPTLRNVALTYPYFHDGSVKDLKEAVQVMAEFQNGSKLSDKEATAIVAFLNALTGEYKGKMLK